MRPQKVDDQQLIIRLLEVLRTRGFEGASMNDMAEASGLKKASLYHRFPGGKQEITEAVLSYVGAWGQEHIYQVLSNSSIPPAQRLTQAIANIRKLYNDGESICLMRVLTTGAGLSLFGGSIATHIAQWKAAFMQFGMDTGMDKVMADKMAIKALSLIQGSLVVSKGLNSLVPFQEMLCEIKSMYLN